jgi:hypothetical protein
LFACLLRSSSSSSSSSSLRGSCSRVVERAIVGSGIAESFCRWFYKRRDPPSSPFSHLSPHTHTFVFIFLFLFSPHPLHPFPLLSIHTRHT